MSKAKNDTNPEPIQARIEKLGQATDWFYGDDFRIDEALPKYQDAIALAEGIERDLDQLQNEVEVLADFTKE